MDIVALGEPLLEFNQVAGTGGDTYLPGFGGDTSNALIAAARQGAKTTYLTRLGADAFGDMFVDLWQKEGVDSSQVIRDPGAPTGIYFVTHSAAGHAFTYFRKGSAASLMRPDELPEGAIAAAKMLHVSGISQAISASACDTVFAAIEIARANGLRVSYDPNLRLKLWPLPRARAVIMETVGLCDICLPSYEEAVQLTGCNEADAVIDRLLEGGARMVALKLGDRGAMAATADERHRVPAAPVETVDATGAGDTFDGAFLTEILRGAPLAAALRYANAAAALSTQGHGAVTPIPDREAVERFLRTTA